jgi:hypothetical protein
MACFPSSRVNKVASANALGKNVAQRLCIRLLTDPTHPLPLLRPCYRRAANKDCNRAGNSPQLRGANGEPEFRRAPLTIENILLDVDGGTDGESVVNGRW